LSLSTLDDILIASPDQQTHLHHLRLVLERLREGGFLLNMDKCQFGAASLEFLSHMVSASLITCPGHHGGSSATGHHTAAEVFRHEKFL
jgi:hypothetical protein